MIITNKSKFTRHQPQKSEWQSLTSELHDDEKINLFNDLTYHLHLFGYAINSESENNRVDHTYKM